MVACEPSAMDMVGDSRQREADNRLGRIGHSFIWAEAGAGDGQDKVTPRADIWHIAPVSQDSHQVFFVVANYQGPMNEENVLALVAQQAAFDFCAARFLP